MKYFFNYPYFRRSNGTTYYRSKNPVWWIEFKFLKSYRFQWWRISHSMIGAFSGSCNNDKWTLTILGRVILVLHRDTHGHFKTPHHYCTEVNVYGEVLLEEYGNINVNKVYKLKSLAVQTEI